jgi:hypothetical protein
MPIHEDDRKRVLTSQLRHGLRAIVRDRNAAAESFEGALEH